MKILQVNKFFYSKGGSETYYFNLCQLLEKKGHQVLHFSMQDERNLESAQSPYFVSYLDISNPKGSILALCQIPRLIWSKEASQKLERIIIQEKPDIAHLHNIDRHLTPSIIPVLKKHKIPVVMTLHDYKVICPNSVLFTHGAICEKCRNGKFLNAVCQKCIKKSLVVSLIGSIEAYIHQLKKVWNEVDLFLSPSHFMEQKMIEFGYVSSKVSYLPLFLPQSRENHKTSSKTENYFLYFGRLEEEKGLDFLIETFSQLPEEKLKIAGSGNLERALKIKVKDLKIKNVEFMGFQDKKDMEKLIEDAKAVIISSIWYENAPFSILEAMQKGKVIIGSRIGGIPELLQNNETGLTFTPQNEKELINKIKWINENSEKALKIGKKAQEKVETEFNEEVHYQKLMEIYEKVRSYYSGEARTI